MPSLPNAAAGFVSLESVAVLALTWVGTIFESIASLPPTEAFASSFLTSALTLVLSYFEASTGFPSLDVAGWALSRGSSVNSLFLT